MEGEVSKWCIKRVRCVWSGAFADLFLSFGDLEVWCQLKAMIYYGMLNSFTRSTCIHLKIARFKNRRRWEANGNSPKKVIGFYREILKYRRSVGSCEWHIFLIFFPSLNFLLSVMFPNTLCYFYNILTWKSQIRTKNSTHWYNIMKYITSYPWSRSYFDHTTRSQSKSSKYGLTM